MLTRVKTLASDLQRIFGARLQSLVAYGDIGGRPGEDAGSSGHEPTGRDHDGVHTLVLVDNLTFQDLAACAPLVAAWRKAGVAVPLVLSRDEFLRSLDVFPLEYGGIIDRHVVVVGESPFAGMEVREADLRRGCELQAKSHLIHLREGYLESGGQPAVVARLIAASAPSLRALAANLERLAPGAAGGAGVSGDLIAEIEAADTTTIADPSALFARYLAAVERLWQQVDRWRP